MKRRRVALLISGRGSNMASLIEATRDPAYPAEIALVLSNRPEAGGLARARAAGIATDTIDHTAFASRAAFEEELQAALEAHRVELVAIVGFMMVLTNGFVECWIGRMM